MIFYGFGQLPSFPRSVALVAVAGMEPLPRCGQPTLRRNNLWCHTTVLLTTLLVFAIPSVLFARQGSLPRSQSQTGQPLTTVTQVVLPAIDRTAQLTKDAVETTSGPLRYAVPIAVHITPQTHGTWESLPDGDRLWRLRFLVPEATDLNFAFTHYRLPAGATLHIVSESEDYYEGPYTAHDNKAHGQLWTPAVPGDSAVLELYLPAAASAAPTLVLTQVNAGYRDLFKRLPREKQGSCNNDVICPEGNAWRNEIRSVGRLSVSGTGLCTGTLIMDVPRSFRRFFLTANHCGLNVGNAPSSVVFWNYESLTCGALSGGSLAQNQTGAIFRVARADVDVALIELDDTPAAAFNVFYSGWDRSGTVPSGNVGIHHPSGDEKAISFNDDPLTTSNSCIGSGGSNTHWHIANWEDGITEPGSSGSGIWDPVNKKLVGFLSGGLSSCSSPAEFDCYGKFSVAWDGSTAATRLRDWLDPLGQGPMTVDGANPSDRFLSINNVTKAEGNSGTTAFDFTVTLSAAAASNVTVTYATANGTAVTPGDYTAIPATVLTFAPGQTSKSVRVAVAGNTTVEPTETFVVNLSAPSGATLADGQGLGTITNDDSTALRITDVIATEGNAGTKDFVFTVTLSNPSATPVTVTYATANGTAIAPGDYAALAPTVLTFTPGQTSKLVRVNVVGDTTVEPNETFLVNLSAPSGATLADGQGRGTILNDDGSLLRITDVITTEGNVGNKNFVFTVTLLPAAATNVTVNCVTANGTAVAPADYIAGTTPLTFTPGQTLKTCTVPVVGNSAPTGIEPNETFFVNLTNVVGPATLFDGQGLGTILNDDGPVLSINNVTVTEGNTGTSNFNFLVTLSPAATTNVTVNCVAANGTATAPGDYTAGTTALTFTPGQTFKTCTVPVVGDGVVELNETFFVNLTSPVGATIIDPDFRGIGTILNDEGPRLRITDVTLTEGNAGTKSFNFLVTLSPAAATNVTVNCVRANGTAVAPGDYTAGTTALTFTPGQTSKTCTVLVVGDAAVEPTETFFVNLTSPVGATIFDVDFRGIGTITNDD
ncbi:MAG: hypothetical protein HOP18_03965 [Deltaproteobacteria bacterium]|nr:hypothetical protein [Deltaproteobacteria bacterium]